MTELLISPESTFRRLMGEASDSRRKESLEAINEVCRLLLDRGSQDFSYRNVVQLGYDRGLAVPSYKSVVNPTGKHYQELIQSWKQLVKVEKRGISTESNNWISKIPDPILRLNVALLEQELRALKSKLARQERAVGGEIYLNRKPDDYVPPYLSLSEIEIFALKSAINADLLAQVGLHLGARGEVEDAKGRKLLKPGFRDAIEKVLSVQIQ